MSSNEAAVAGASVLLVDVDDRSGTPALAGSTSFESAAATPDDGAALRGFCGLDRSALFTVDGYCRTGDLGRLDADGYLWYSGRLDDTFKVKGATVYPSEVEVALRSVPGVSQAFVTNVTDRDGREQVGALVVTCADDPGTAGLVEAARARLSSFTVPTVWRVTTEPDVVPRSATGKVDKARLQQVLHSTGGDVQ